MHSVHLTALALAALAALAGFGAGVFSIQSHWTLLTTPERNTSTPERRSRTHR